MDHVYSAFYARFETSSKAQGSVMMGPDHLVGDDYGVFFKTEDGKVTACLRNRFGAESGYFDADTSRKLQLANARDQKIRAILSFIAYSDEPDPGMYWGQMALFCYDPLHTEEIDPFIDRVAAKIADGVRPKIDLGSKSVQKMLNDPSFMPKENMPLPEKQIGSAVLKDHRSMSEKMIEQGRARNKGCYAVSYLFIIIVIIAIVYGLHVAGLF